MSDPFRFDQATGFITQDGVPRQVWALCGHLRAPLVRLRTSGSELLGVTTSWTGTDLAVTLTSGPALKAVASSLGPLEPDVVPWSNNDTHYPVEFGVACRSCRQTLAWPQTPGWKAVPAERDVTVTRR